MTTFPPRTVLALLVCLLPAVAAAQPVPVAPPYQPALDPQQQQVPLRAPLTVIPSLTISEEFNDNVRLSNRDREWDFITGFTPAIRVLLESRTYRLAAGYDFTAQFYARDSDRNSAFDRQNFTLDTSWRPTERLTLSLADGFSLSTDTNVITPEGVSTGRGRSWSNTLTGGAAYRIDALTTVRGGASYGAQRYGGDELRDSDTYRADAGVDRAFTRRLSGTLAYQFAYFNFKDQGDQLNAVTEGDVTTHTPRLGLTYRLTETITVSGSAGPTFEIRDRGGDRVTPAVTATYRQRVFFGSIGAAFDRAVGTAGGLGGTTDNTSVGGSVEVITLMRGLTLAFEPRWTSVQSDTDRVDVKTITLPLQATYRFTPWMAVVARYQFYQQRSDSTIQDRNGNFLAEDADQNRLFVGLQFGYPLTFDRP